MSKSTVRGAIIDETDAFVLFANQTGLLYDSSDSPYPTRLYGVAGESDLELNQDGKSSFYGFVECGYIEIVIDAKNFKGQDQPQKFVLHSGQYFATPWPFEIYSYRNSRAMVVERIGHQCLNQFGGPISAEGRLQYINGCTDTMLIGPVKKGAPCFNHLHFPERVVQTMHTHPSIRVGMVYNGYGHCRTPFGELPLDKGNLFVIKPNYHGEKATRADGEVFFVGSHKFDTTDSPMDVIAYHPDTTVGPEDENHPMINRTIVDGIPASEIPEIQTGTIMKARGK